MPPVISIESLSKAYRLGQIGTGTFAYDLQLWWAKTRAKPNPLLRIGETDHGNRAGETIWALKDVSFTVEQGEVLGIIGRNGAGKSTLLKVLSRITAPTSGRVRIKGRVASLLEVGTGFHPELTGRENVYLNGAILGMSRPEIDRKFDEIVGFAEIEKFVDTPVKRYSSGMYVRLAFAVAAHLEPEILVVDEVLAVGDADFQKKCLGKMGQVAREGRTVLFVSHNMGAIQKLTKLCVLLKKGTLAAAGPTQDVVETYLNSAADSASYDVSTLPRRSDELGERIKIQRLEPVDACQSGFYFGQDLQFYVSLLGRKSVTDLCFGATVLDLGGSAILSVMSEPSIEVPIGQMSIYKLTLRDPRLAPGHYQLALSVFDGALTEARTIYDLVNPGITFSVLPFSQSGEAVMNWKRGHGTIVHPFCDVRRFPEIGESPH